VSASRISLGRLWALMLTGCLDMAGLMMIAPVFPFYAKRLGLEEFWIGVLTSMFALAQLATAPFWGKLSDRRGRRPVLRLGMLVSVGAHLLFALACSNWALGRFDASGLVALLFVSRIVQGVGGSTTGVVQAYVADTVASEERAKALGWISAATMAGVVLGSLLGSLAAFAGPASPGITAAALCLFNFFFIGRFVRESASEEARAEAVTKQGHSVRQRVYSVLRRPGEPISRLIWIYGVGMMAFTAMYAMLALFLLARFAFTEKSMGLVYALVGIVGMVVRVSMLGPAISRFGERGVMRLGLGLLIVGFPVMASAPTISVFLLAMLLVPIGQALLFPATTSLVSRFAERHERGKILGVQHVYGGVARLVGPIWAGAAFQWLSPGAPFWISAAVVAVTLGFALGLAPPPATRERAIELPLDA